MGNATADVRSAAVLTPSGNSLHELWQQITEPARTEPFDIGGNQILVRRCDFDPSDLLTASQMRRMDRSHQLGVAAVDRVLADYSGQLPDPARCAVSVGIGYGASGYSETQMRAYITEGPRAVNPLAVPLSMPNSLAAQLSLRHGFTGPATTYATACASGATAIGEALWLLRNDRADLVVAGGVDAMIVGGIASFFARLDAMSNNFDNPARASRPFDVDREGFVLGEGAAFLVLVRSDDNDSDQPRLGRVAGYGATSDAHHLVAPPDDGRGAAACMSAALMDADVAPADVAHINAHGTSTPRNDSAEAAAILEVFGASTPPVTAPKGATGHLVGGSGAVECVISLLALQHDCCPPVVGLVDLDPAIAIDAVIGKSRPVDGEAALSNSFGFGGHNATLVMTK